MQLQKSCLGHVCGKSFPIATFVIRLLLNKPVYFQAKKDTVHKTSKFRFGKVFRIYALTVTDKVLLQKTFQSTVPLINAFFGLRIFLLPGKSGLQQESNLIKNYSKKTCDKIWRQITMYALIKLPGIGRYTAAVMPL